MKFRRSICATGLLVCAALAHADARIEVVWTCTLNDGKSLEDVQAVNGKWLKWNRDNGIGGVTSHVANMVLGGELTTILLIDSYPGWETYAEEAAKYDSPEGEALDAAFAEVVTCPSNTVWQVQESGVD
jgi:hypothetical protein